MGEIAWDITATISTVMGEVLTRDPLSHGDDFFLCGGDSLLAVQLISRLAARFGVGDEDVAERLRSSLLMAVFDEATPDALAPVVGAELMTSRDGQPSEGISAPASAGRPGTTK